MNYSNLIHTSESFLKLEETYQSFLTEIKNIVEINDMSKAVFMRAIHKNKINIDPMVFSIIKNGDSIEMWSSEETLIMALGGVAKNCTYTIEELRSNKWDELFYRDEKIKAEIFKSYYNIVSTGQSQFSVGGWHEVTELRSKYKYKQCVNIKCIAPYQFGSKTGIIAVVETKPPLRVYDRLRQDFLTFVHRNLTSSKN